MTRLSDNLNNLPFYLRREIQSLIEKSEQLDNLSRNKTSRFDSLMKLSGVTLDKLKQEKEVFEFGWHHNTNNDERLICSIIHTLTGCNEFFRNGHKKKVIIKCRAIDAAKIAVEYDFQKSQMKEALENAFQSFLKENQITPAPTIRPPAQDGNLSLQDLASRSASSRKIRHKFRSL